MSNVETPEARLDVEEVVRIDVDEVDRPNTADANADEVEEENSMKRRTKRENLKCRMISQ